MFLSAFVSQVCLFVSRITELDPFSQNSVERRHGPRKKPLDFGGNPDHVTLALGLGTVSSGVARILCQGAQVWRREKTVNNKCISYHPRQQPVLTNMRYCIRPVCHSYSVQ